jgi:lipoyl(octanoyl) transferase
MQIIAVRRVLISTMQRTSDFRRRRQLLTWKISPGLTPYLDAVTFMENRADEIAKGRAGELIWLVEHPPLYTAGTSAKLRDLIDPNRFDVFQTRRGGQYTYHGPGQRIAYVMLNVGARGRDVRAFVKSLEDWIIATLARFDVQGERRQGRVGVWVVRPDKQPNVDGTPCEDKIAAIGVRLRKWVSFHGISINVDPDLGHYDGIVPCGVADQGVTSLVDLGVSVTLADVDLALKKSFSDVFGETE